MKTGLIELISSAPPIVFREVLYNFSGHEIEYNSWPIVRNHVLCNVALSLCTQGVQLMHGINNSLEPGGCFMFKLLFNVHNLRSLDREFYVSCDSKQRLFSYISKTIARTYGGAVFYVS
jgi:hypothetical protein